jgi:hypothetical protein
VGGEGGKRTSSIPWMRILAWGAVEREKFGLLLCAGLTFLRGFGIKIPKNRLTLPAPAFGTLVLPLLPVLYWKEQGILLVAVLAFELIIWHRRTSSSDLGYGLRHPNGHQTFIFGPHGPKTLILSGFQTGVCLRLLIIGRFQSFLSQDPCICRSIVLII